MATENLPCDPCGAVGVPVRFCYECGIDFCEDCSEFHAAAHEEVVKVQEQVAGWY